MWVPPFEAPELCFYLNLQKASKYSQTGFMTNKNPRHLDRNVGGNIRLVMCLVTCPQKHFLFCLKKTAKRVNKITSYLIYITVCYFPRMWWCCCCWWWWWWRHSRALLCLSFPTQKEAFHEFYVTSCLPFWWKERSHSSLCSSCMVKYHAESSEWKLHVFATYLIV